MLEVDVIYRALSHPRRRYLCYLLFEATEWPLSELAARIAALEHDTPEHTVTAHQREQVSTSLYHAHVPKLAADGIVTYDEDTGTVTVAERAHIVLSALRGIAAAIEPGLDPGPRNGLDDEEAKRGNG